MKKTLLFALALTMCMSCAAKKQVKQAQEPQKSATELEIERLKAEKELRALKAELEQDSIKREQQKELDAMKFEMTKSQMNMTKSLEAGLKLLFVPCAEEALTYESSMQMAAFGVASDQESKDIAIIAANHNALEEISSRFLGVIKNGCEAYYKNTTGESGDNAKKNQLQGLAAAAGEKAINELFKTGCREIATNKKGNYDIYVALYVDKKEVMDRVLDAVEEAEVDVDNAMFRARLQAELDNEAAKQAAINQQKAEQLKAAKEGAGME